MSIRISLRALAAIVAIGLAALSATDASARFRGGFRLAPRITFHHPVRMHFRLYTVRRTFRWPAVRMNHRVRPYRYVPLLDRKSG